MSSVITSINRPPSHERQDEDPTMAADDAEECRQPSAINLSTPRRTPEHSEHSDNNTSSVIRVASSLASEHAPSPLTIKSHESLTGSSPMMVPHGLQHMQHLIQQHLSPAQFQNFFQQQGLLMQQQQHHQLAEINKKQLEDGVRQLQEQLQLIMYQQNQAVHDKSKSAALSLHQSQLMQQLQLLQQRYLLQQAGMGQPGAPAGVATSEASGPPWEQSSERRPEAPSPPASSLSPPVAPPPPPPLVNGRRSDLRADLRNGVDEERSTDDDDLAAKTSPLFSNGICNWPGCEAPCEDMAAFLKHLNTDHVLDDRSAAHARVQVQVVQQMENNLAKEKARLAAMMAHFHMAREKMAEPPLPEPPVVSTHPKVSASVFPSTAPASQLLSGHPFLRSAILQGGAPPVASTASAVGPVRRRANDKSLTPGPYDEAPTQTQRRRVAERAGQDITEELSRNREFYRTTDIRPPFTYASLIRQAIVESPDKQLTLNEIYSWFQSTFAYFRRNAATWKNAVRHNLSLHKCFTRVENVKGAVWTVDEVEFCKRRPQRSAGQTRSPTLSNSPTLYGDTISSGLQSALVDSNLPFMANAAERLREMRERDAPTLLGLQRRSASPPSLVAARHRPASGSPELRLPVTSLLNDTPHAPQPPPPAGQHTEYTDNPRTPESRDGGASRDAVAENGNNGAEDLSMPAVKMEYTESNQSMEAASA
ncbi:forkhead box protein P1-like isoform X2 [Amphibalanus amphitrite]|uniref:forkhead box protein P1-like isoform X2 n=1 Tax=Amphibalanus amphitrite TaxID=1232801 RepID=UPI001C91B499|nr:forkhead box protein P1-like isoform X2 [Amphibalanus amphitrite]